MQKFVIEGRLEALNQYTRTNRSNRYKGAKDKKANDLICRAYIRKARLKPVKHYPIRLFIDWYEKNQRRDYDNVAFAKKFILDSLIAEGIIEGDGQRYVIGSNETIHIDKENPRIEIKIFESEED